MIRKKGETLMCPRDNRLGTAYVDAVADGSAGKSDYMLPACAYWGWGKEI